MSELDDKKKVAEWFGWVVEGEWYDKNKNGLIKPFEDWNPQSDEFATFKEWDEIYENMSIPDTVWFMNKLEILCKCMVVKMVKAKPSIRFKALLQMIGEK